MSTQAKLIAINLKHFYQRRGCWFYYLILFFVILPPFLAFTGFSHDANGFHLSAGEPRSILSSMLFLSFFLNMLGGMLAGDLVRSVAARTFSTCLPGYKRLPAITIAIMGLIVNVGYTALVILGASHLFYSIVLIFSLGIFVYVNMAVVVLKSLNPAAFFGFSVVWGSMDLLPVRRLRKSYSII